MKTTLTFEARFVLINLLDNLNRSSFEKLVAKKSLLQKIELNTKDLESINFETKAITENNTTVSFDKLKAQNLKINIDLSDIEKNVLTDLLKELSQKEMLEEPLFYLYEQLI